MSLGRLWAARIQVAGRMRRLRNRYLIKRLLGILLYKGLEGFPSGLFSFCRINIEILQGDLHALARQITIEKWRPDLMKQKAVSNPWVLTTD